MDMRSRLDFLSGWITGREGNYNQYVGQITTDRAPGEEDKRTRDNTSTRQSFSNGSKSASRAGNIVKEGRESERNI